MLRQACRLWWQRWMYLRKVQKANGEVLALLSFAGQGLSASRELAASWEMRAQQRAALPTRKLG